MSFSSEDPITSQPQSPEETTTSTSFFPSKNPNTKRSKRPTLTVNDLLIHAFGKHEDSAAASPKGSPKAPAFKSLSTEALYLDTEGKNISPSTQLRKSSPPFTGDKDVPSGSFRSFKSSKQLRKNMREVSLTELNPFSPRLHTLSDKSPTPPPHLHNRSDQNTHHEPTSSSYSEEGKENISNPTSITSDTPPATSQGQPLTREEWRQKSNQRTEWRRRRKIALAFNGGVHGEFQLPLDIDCHAVMGSTTMGLVPSDGVPSFSRSSEGMVKLAKSLSGSEPQSPRVQNGGVSVSRCGSPMKKKGRDDLAAHCAAFWSNTAEKTDATDSAVLGCPGLMTASTPER